MSHHLTVRIECHSHIRSLTGRVLNDMEHLRRMKEISARQLWQLAPFRIQVYLILAHRSLENSWSNYDSLSAKLSIFSQTPKQTYLLFRLLLRGSFNFIFRIRQGLLLLIPNSTYEQRLADMNLFMRASRNSFRPVGLIFIRLYSFIFTLPLVNINSFQSTGLTLERRAFLDEVHNLLLISQLLYIPSLRGSLWLRKSSVGGANTGDIRAYARIVVLSHDFYAPESPVLSPQSL